MADEMKNPASETAPNTNAYSESGIDFSNVSALGSTDYKPDPWIKRFGISLGESIVKLLLFIFGFVLDIIKALWAVISGVFIYIYRLIKGICVFFRNKSRVFREVDAYGKWSFLCQGLGLMKHGQVADGIIFLAVELLFIAYMALSGVSSIAGLFSLDAVKRSSHIRLVLGIMAIIIIVAYIFVYLKGIQAVYDNYQIIHELDFRRAREDAIDALTHNASFDEDLTKCGHGKVYRLMRDKYGYSELSARYISYVDFKRVPERKPNIFIRCIDGIKNGFYKGYKRWAEKVRAGKWASVFADFLNWELVKRKPRTGIDVVKNELEIQLLKFRHTYDKYNNYHSVVRDSKATLRCLGDEVNLLKAAYADDEVSKRNGIAPIDHHKKPKAKELLSRVVGFFEVSLPVGLKVSKLLAEILRSHADDEARLEAIRRANEKEKIFLDEFVADNLDGAKACAKGIRDCLTQYQENAVLFEKGQKDFIAHVKTVYLVDDYHANVLYRYYRFAKANYSSEDEKIAYLNRAAERFDPLGKLMDESAFHGQVLGFKKQAKQYLDEKFAVTVLALPTLGALLTCVIPLVFSIAIAFTNWNSTHTAYLFNWDMGAWKDVFGMGANGGEFLETFGILLRWTIVWAILATFSNYIMGIVLALMINKKGIKMKSLWRTCFVLTIAIPQFITLLVISLLFAPDGALNKWLNDTFGFAIPFLGSIQGSGLNPAFELDSNYTFVKFMIVVINMWVGIPYTMLSTSGILMNIPGDLYESAQIDGANAWTQFWKITMPYIIFVTGPSLLTTFIGNINNFNVIYFLTGGSDGVGTKAMLHYSAGQTDLLITWLFRITAAKTTPEYAMGSVIGVLMFVVCAFFSLIMYKRMGSVKNEEAFQ